MIEDAELLRRYAEDGAEDAFTELVYRNLDLVHAAALRQLGDAHLARDVAQSVFVDLARKAHALRRHPSLVSWLHTSTRFAAINARRTAQRRRVREQEAHAMQPSHDHAPEWERIRPLLDDVLHELGERDREIVLLRYFRGLPFAELAARLGLSEGAARMRIDRALARMNRALTRRGIASSATALGVALAHQPAFAAPAGLAAAVTGAALHAGAASAGAGGGFATLLAMTKIKMGLTAALLVVCALPVLYQVRAHQTLNTELAVAQSEARTHQSPPFTSASNPIATPRPSNASFTEPTVDAVELRRAKARLAVLKARPAEVTDATLRPSAAWQNRGRATPEAAYETQFWAALTGDRAAYGSTYSLSDESIASIKTYFDTLPPEARTRYGTPERFFSERLWDLLEPAKNLPAAFQVLTETSDKNSAQPMVRAWVQLASGEERLNVARFATGPNGWGIAPSRPLTEAYWRELFSLLDPATGEFVAGGAERFRRSGANSR